MKSFLGLVIIGVAITLLASTSTSAQTGITITINEANPIVTLPFPVLPGPLFICETTPITGGCGSNADISDELSFITQTAGATMATAMCLFSDPNPSFGQTGTPEFPDNSCPGSGFGGNFTSILETRAPDGSETMIYTPGPGQAGFALSPTSGLPVTYVITSDSANESDTPEPASLILLGSGILGLAATIRRKLN